MKILILCGGKGKRLREKTLLLPKPLIKLNNKPILQIKIEEYLKQGFNNFIFCVGYKAREIEKAVLKFDGKSEYFFSDAGENAGILERIYYARDNFDKEVIVTYGDTYLNIDLKKFIDVHKKGDNLATIVVIPIENPFGLVNLDLNKVKQFDEKPVLNYYVGYSIIEKSAFDMVPLNVIKMPNGEGLVTFFKILIALDKLGAYCHTGIHITFNTNEELILAENKFIDFYTERSEINDK